MLATNVHVLDIYTIGTNFATGGDDDTISVGSILNYFNPNIVGLSKGNTNPTVCYGPFCFADTPSDPMSPKIHGLDAALSGAWSTESNTKRMIRYLDRTMPLLAGQELAENGWKVI